MYIIIHIAFCSTDIIIIIIIIITVAIIFLSVFIFLVDLSVTHLQLLLLIWHNFSKDTRKTLLLKSVDAVNRVAEEKE